MAEEGPRFARFKTCELRRLMEGGNAIRALDQRGNLLWSVRRNPKADVYRGHQLPLEILVIDSHCSLERADEVADDIFRRIVEKCGEAVRPRKSWLQFLHETLDDEAVLRNRERMRATRLTVPARDAGKAVRNVGNLDVER